jgi:hypothetical protein
VFFDANFPYLQYTQIIPQYSFAHVIDDGEIDAEADALETKDYNFNGSGMFAKYFATTGGRPEIGYLPRWEVRWLYTMHPRLWHGMLNNADVSAHIPVHYRESYDGATPRYFIDVDLDGDSYSDSGDSSGGDVHGRIVSIESRPTWESGNPGSGDVEDRTAALVTLSASHGWSVDQAHQSAFAFLAYLTTGDYYLLEELQFWSAFNVALTNDVSDQRYGRKRSWGILSYAYQTRGMAWAIRNLAHSIMMTPAADLEGEYLRAKLTHKIQAYEGEHLLLYPQALLAEPLTNATYANPCPSSAGVNPETGASYSSFLNSSFLRTRNTPYCHGMRQIKRSAATANPLGFPTEGDEYAGVSTTWTTSSTTNRIDSPWMIGYHALVLGRLRELGFPVDGIHRHFSRLQINTGGNPEHNKYLCCTYRLPVLRLSDTNYFQSWKHHLSAYTASGQTKSTWNTNCGGDASDCGTNASDGYLHIYMAAISFMTGYADAAARGDEVYSWFTNNANVPYQAKTNSDGLVDTKWALVKRKNPVRVIRAQPGSSQFLVQYQAPDSEACTVVVDDTPDLSSPVHQAADGGGPRIRLVVVGGLSPQTYHYSISCEADYYTGGKSFGSFSLSAAGGPTTLPVRLNAPAGTSDAVVDFGSTSSLGSSTDPLSCSNTCTVDIPAVQRQVLYYAVRFRNASSGTIASGQIMAALP